MTTRGLGTLVLDFFEGTNLGTQLLTVQLGLGVSKFPWAVQALHSCGFQSRTVLDRNRTCPVGTSVLGLLFRHGELIWGAATGTIPLFCIGFLNWVGTLLAG